jgi:penicillin amidase/acyl-homoserine-lactone acylase
VGHNEHLGWGHTVNAPDLVDIYELEIHPDDSYLYKYDGQWKQLKVKKVPIKVKLFGPFSWTFKKEALWSIHGPVLRGKYAAYAMRFANYEDIRVIEQWYRMNKAANFEEWQSAMQMMAIPMFGTGYADKDGNILYLYNAKLPLRTEGYDWQGVLPGNSSEVVWTEYLPYEDLPQVLNPPSGFIQNCNNTPFTTTTGNGNPNQENYPDSFGIESRMSNRALRAMELFGKDMSISAEEFEQYKFDLHYSDDSYMSLFVDRLISLSHNFEDDQLQEGVNVLKAWDKNTDFENINASLPIISFGWFMETLPTDVSDENLIESFTFAVKYLYNHYGKLDVIWGKVNRLVRGSVNLGVGGGPDISRAVYGIPTKEGYLKGYAGDAFLMMVEWGKDGEVNSRSIHQYGSNTQHETSTHYADQSKLFVKQKLKPVWLKLQTIKENLEHAYSPGNK